MTLIVHVAKERVRVPVASARVVNLAQLVLRAEKISDALISIAFVSSSAIARLNQQHLGRRGATDVISFAMGQAGGPIVGDIYICPDEARKNSVRFNTAVREEVARLVVHGVLHAVGHDHPEGEDRTTSAMWLRQEKLLSRLLPLVYRQ